MGTFPPCRWLARTARLVVIAAWTAATSPCGSGGDVVGARETPPPSTLPPPGTEQARLCRDFTHPLPVLAAPPDVLVVFDRSGSMAAEFGPQTRFAAAAHVLGDLVGVYQDKIRFGLQVFPAARTCDAGPGCCVEPPGVPLGLRQAPGVAAGIAAASPPTGSTPTADALRTARLHYQRLADGVAQRYVLLATDGRPSCGLGGSVVEADTLDGNGVPVAGPCHDALTEVDALVAAGIKVIVLGLGPGLEADPGGGPSCLDEIARRGGAGRPGGRPHFYPATDPLELERALQQIFGGVSRPSCSVELAMTPANPGAVAVFLDGHELPRSRHHGWDYDPPDDRRRIRIFGEYCRRLDRFQVATVEVRFGCPPCVDGRCDD